MVMIQMKMEWWKKLYLRCEECGATTEVVFEGNDGDNPTYTTGKVVE